MGTHLYKKMGWGLTGLEHDKDGRLTDPRINASALDQPWEDIGPEYLAYLEAVRDAERCGGDDVDQPDAWFDVMMTIEMVKAAREQEKVIPWPVTRETESGRKDLLLIQPPGFPGWTRYGDALDQNEENALHPDTYFRIVPLPYGIYPFEGVYMDDRTGDRVDSTAKRMIDRLLHQPDPEVDIRPERVKAADHLARTMGFDNALQALRHIAPIVPDDIKQVISWLNLFNGPDVWRQLRPMIYIYWS